MKVQKIYTITMMILLWLILMVYFSFSDAAMIGGRGRWLYISDFYATPGVPLTVECVCGNDYMNFFDKVRSPHDQGQGGNQPWLRRDNRLRFFFNAYRKPNGDIMQPTIKYTMSNPTTEDTGRYTCGSRWGNKVNFTVHMKYDIKPVKKKQILLLNEKHRNMIMVDVSGSLPIIQWRKWDNKKNISVPIVYFKEDFLFKKQNTSDKYMISRKNGSLTINNLGLSDIGRYEVRLSSNKYGNKTEQMEVAIEEKPSIVSTNSKVIAVKGLKNTIRCSATGVPKPNFTLALPTGVIKGKTTVKLQGNAVVLEHVVDAGPVYLTCIARNTHGFAAVRLSLPNAVKPTEKSRYSAGNAGNKQPADGKTSNNRQPTGNRNSTAGQMNRKSQTVTTAAVSKSVIIKGALMIGGVVLLVLLIVIRCCIVCRRRRANRLASEEEEQLVGGKNLPTEYIFEENKTAKGEATVSRNTKKGSSISRDTRHGSPVSYNTKRESTVSRGPRREPTVSINTQRESTVSCVNNASPPMRSRDDRTQQSSGSRRKESRQPASSSRVPASSSRVPASSSRVPASSSRVPPSSSRGPPRHKKR